MYLGFSAVILVSGGAVTYYYDYYPFPESAKRKISQLFRQSPSPHEQDHDQDLHSVSNWSGTHEVRTRVFLQPETLDQLERIVKDAHEKKQRIRPVGSGLSPNGIGLTEAGMVNLGLMDKVLEVDKGKKRVRVQAGIRVQQLVDEIKEFGLTLQNFASIREQQIGGIMQVGLLFFFFLLFPHCFHDSSLFKFLRLRTFLVMENISFSEFRTKYVRACRS